MGEQSFFGMISLMRPILKNGDIDIIMFSPKDYADLLMNSIYPDMNPGLKIIFIKKIKEMLINLDLEQSRVGCDHFNLKTLDGRQLNTTENDLKFEEVNANGRNYSIYCNNNEPNKITENFKVNTPCDCDDELKLNIEMNKASNYNAKGIEIQQSLRKVTIIDTTRNNEDTMSAIELDLKRFEEEFLLQKVDYRIYGKMFATFNVDSVNCIKGNFITSSHKWYNRITNVLEFDVERIFEEIKEYGNLSSEQQRQKAFSRFGTSRDLLFGGDVKGLVGQDIYNAMKTYSSRINRP